jgi:hypothetical protein
MGTGSFELVTPVAGSGKIVAFIVTTFNSRNDMVNHRRHPNKPV